MKRHLFTTLVIAVSAFGLLQSDAIAVDIRKDILPPPDRRVLA